jgi:hypothetical protein
VLACEWHMGGDNGTQEWCKGVLEGEKACACSAKGVGVLSAVWEGACGCWGAVVWAFWVLLGTGGGYSRDSV